MVRYFVVQGTDELGPFDEAELHSLIAQGCLGPASGIRAENGGRIGTLAEIIPANTQGGMAAESCIEPAPAAEPIATAGDNPVGSTTPTKKSGWWTIAGTAIIAAAAVFFFVRRGQWTFFDGIDLVFHEAGHLILGFFPRFIVFLGGTLGQLAVPGLCVFYFTRHEKTFASQFSLLWLGQSVLNVSNYVADARAMVLPLLGGGEHDWNYLLGALGLLKYDAAIGQALNILALGIFLVAVAVPWLHRRPVD